jgi:hypothetical protein
MKFLEIPTTLRIAVPDESSLDDMNSLMENLSTTREEALLSSVDIVDTLKEDLPQALSPLLLGAEVLSNDNFDIAE